MIPVIEDARREARGRGVTYEWVIGNEGGKEQVAVLSISHTKAGPNYFNGEYVKEDYFGISVRNEEIEKSDKGWTSRSFMVFGGLGIGRIPAGSRYSAKKLADAEARAIDVFKTMVRAEDERLLAYFDRSTEAVAA